MAPTKLDLQRMEMRKDELVKKYAMRLREMTTQFYHLLIENELNSIFIVITWLVSH